MDRMGMLGIEQYFKQGPYILIHKSVQLPRSRFSFQEMKVECKFVSQRMVYSPTWLITEHFFTLQFAHQTNGSSAKL